MTFDMEKARDAVKMYNSRNPNVNTAVWAHNCAEQLPDAIDLIEQQVAKITTLEAELAEMHKCALEVAGFLAEKKNLEEALVEERADKECNIQLIEFCPNQADMEKYPHFATAEKCWTSINGEITVILNHVENFTHLKIHQRDDLKLFGFQLMQAIKDKILGQDVAAVQIFPRSDDLVDGSNTYHLWTWDGINDQIPNLHEMKRYS